MSLFKLEHRLGHPENCLFFYHDSMIFVRSKYPKKSLFSLKNKIDADTAAAADLLFIQNGNLQDWLSSQGLQNNTQALIYFAVAKMGDKPTDGITDTNPEGLTAGMPSDSEFQCCHFSR